MHTPHRMYAQLAAWYPLLDPAADHADEGAAFTAALKAAIRGPAQRLLELGSGAGHNAVHMKADWSLTLVDPAPGMRALSQALNPDATHVDGDMRTLRLPDGQAAFDGVLVHDAVCYMATPGDLRAAIQTAFWHTRPGGAVLFAPDHYAGDFAPYEDTEERSGDGRWLRTTERTWQPEPGAHWYRVDYRFEADGPGGPFEVQEHHIEGLFSRAQWRAWLTEAGFAVSEVPRPIGDGEFDQVWVGRRG